MSTGLTLSNGIPSLITANITTGAAILAMANITTSLTSMASISTEVPTASITIGDTTITITTPTTSDLVMTSITTATPLLVSWSIIDSSATPIQQPTAPARFPAETVPPIPSGTKTYVRTSLDLDHHKRALWDGVTGDPHMCLLIEMFHEGFNKVIFSKHHPNNTAMHQYMDHQRPPGNSSKTVWKPRLYPWTDYVLSFAIVGPIPDAPGCCEVTNMGLTLECKESCLSPFWWWYGVILQCVTALVIGIFTLWKIRTTYAPEFSRLWWRYHRWRCENCREIQRRNEAFAWYRHLKNEAEWKFMEEARNTNDAVKKTEIYQKEIIKDQDRPIIPEWSNYYRMFIRGDLDAKYQYQREIIGRTGSDWMQSSFQTLMEQNQQVMHDYYLQEYAERYDPHAEYRCAYYTFQEWRAEKRRITRAYQAQTRRELLEEEEANWEDVDTDEEGTDDSDDDCDDDSDDDSDEDSDNDSDDDTDDDSGDDSDDYGSDDDDSDDSDDSDNLDEYSD
ncbi:Protein of unknown function [Pyronema omphalodes CBS 100304]|uniref:Uncharacterized protein n=1 Tax=Pyronema omphalodes (strain CBS 100304) TaxID=1076935 RepID=U4LAA4_PYROM|nr:Protein of unknown function [Pyronema omphalodes CBS 100304]